MTLIYLIYDDQLKENRETRTKAPIPFYKEGVKSPAGYVIETDKQVMVCYHGTQFNKILSSGGTEIKHDLQIGQKTMKFGNNNLKVHRGFKSEYESSKESLFEALRQTDPNKTVNASGHSLGGATSQIFALDAATNHPKIKIGMVHTYGSPRVFSIEAAQKYNEVGLGDKTLRIKQKYDPVPRLVPKKKGYAHVGSKVSVNANVKSVHSGSIYRKIGSKVLTVDDIANARQSDKPVPIKTYCTAISRLTKETFLAALESIKKISKSISETKDVISNNVNKMVSSMINGFRKNTSNLNYKNVPTIPKQVKDKGTSR